MTLISYYKIFLGKIDYSKRIRTFALSYVVLSHQQVRKTMGTYINKENNASIFLLFRSLNRTSDLCSKILTFGKIKQKQAFFCFFAHLIVSL